MMFNNMIFLWFLISSLIMSLSSSSLFFLWMCLEINIMSFIPLMHSKNSMNMNSIMMYFLIQSTASSIFIFSVSIHFMNLEMMKFLEILITISMLIKLGVAPFHIWFPQISEGLTFESLGILLTIQKIIPLYIMSMFKSKLILIFIIVSSIIGSVGGFNQFSIRKILAFSSIAHLAWILSLLMINSNFWSIYLTIYSIIIMMILILMKINSMNLYNFSKKINNEMNLLFIILLLSLGGMPPTIGFIMKWISLKIVSNNLMFLMIPLIISSLINLFFYLRLGYNSFLKNIIFNKWSQNSIYKIMTMLMIQFSLIFIVLSYI
uniref:NADH-ubiquinone oxidoreductase chain 2 n=1 Tax=Carios mexicanus TaxID=34600 RepID=W0FHX2_CARMN|nr:NADH dehydrogenase subunit 2 [Antricola mexicanus]AHF21652.1 NADH dehydrogenase subunit 2 [Antricola mexicanus]